MSDTTTTTVRHSSHWAKALLIAIALVAAIIAFPYLAMLLAIFGLTVPVFLVALVLILALSKIFELFRKA